MQPIKCFSLVFYWLVGDYKNQKGKSWKKLIESKEIIEIFFHGRGGQTAITASQLLAEMAYEKGFIDTIAIPIIGAERRGAPIMAFTKISEKKPIRTSTSSQPAPVIPRCLCCVFIVAVSRYSIPLPIRSQAMGKPGRSLSQLIQMPKAFPTRFSSGTRPQQRLSLLLSLLSPITK